MAGLENDRLTQVRHTVQERSNELSSSLRPLAEILRDVTRKHRIAIAGIIALTTIVAGAATGLVQVTNEVFGTALAVAVISAVDLARNSVQVTKARH